MAQSVPMFLPGSLFDNIDKFASSLGFENASIAIPLAMIPWDTPEDRDAFIHSVTGDMPHGGETTSYPLPGLKA